MSKANTIPLTYPIVVGGETISEITFERPKAKRARLLAQAEGLVPLDGSDPSGEAKVEQTFLLIRAVTGLSDDEVGEIDMMEDLPRVGEAVASFLESIAPKPSPGPNDGEA